MLVDVSWVPREQSVVRHTLQELLASILLKESLVHDGSREVVDHELQDRLDLLLRVAGVVCEGVILWMLVGDCSIEGMITYPRATLEDETSKVHSSGSNLAWGVGEETMVQAANLEEVLAQCAGLDVVVVGL